MKFLIAGLGNIGAEYEGTRHNVGFDVLDELVKERKAAFDLQRFGYRADFRYKGKQFHLVKPTTYMNLSGRSIRYWMQTLKIPQSNLLIVLDDVALPFGKLRMKGKGSDGGHNGLKHITEILGNQNYARLRFGVGDNFSRGRQAQYVLGKWTNDEAAELPNHVEKAAAGILNFGTMGLGRTMNLLN